MDPTSILLTHFDPANAAIVILCALFLWLLFGRDVRWHSAWIKKHSTECDEQRKQNNEILTELRTTNARLATLADVHCDRIERLEHQVDAVRAK